MGVGHSEEQSDQNERDENSGMGGLEENILHDATDSNNN